MRQTAVEAGIPPSSEPGPERPPERGTLSKKAAWVLVALCAWTLYVWISRIFIMAGQDESTGFKVVHSILAAISIAFGLAAGWIGLRRLRQPHRADEAEGFLP